VKAANAQPQRKNVDITLLLAHALHQLLKLSTNATMLKLENVQEENVVNLFQFAMENTVIPLKNHAHQNSLAAVVELKPLSLINVQV